MKNRMAINANNLDNGIPIPLLSRKKTTAHSTRNQNNEDRNALLSMEPYLESYEPTDF